MNGAVLREHELVEYAQGCKKLITALEPIDEKFLAAMPELEVISKYGVGIDMLDTKAMARHKVRLGWTGGVNKRSVSELVIALCIALLRQVTQSHQELRDRVWKNRVGRCLTGRTVGIIGCGHIGKDLTRILQSFDCKVLANDILSFPEFYNEHNVEAVDLDDLLRRADIVTLHVPLDDSTRNLLSADRLAKMKPQALLINVARGGLVDEEALKAALVEGRVGGAAFDVFSMEPPEDWELIRLPNFIGTPHIGGSSEEAILAMGRAAIRGLDDNTIPSKDFPG